MRRTLVAASLLLAVGSLLHAEQYDLRSRYKPGQVMLVKLLVKSTLKITDSTPDGLADIVKGAFVHRQRSEVRYTIVDVRGWLPAVSKAEVLVAEETTAAPGEEERAVPSRLAGKTVTVRTDPRGKSTFTDEHGQELDSEECGEWCDGLRQPFFRETDACSAAVGQEWTIAGSDARRAMHIAKGGQASSTLRFAEVLAQDEHKLARLLIEARISEPVEGNMPLTRLTDLSGECLWDIGRQVPCKISATGIARVEGKLIVDGKDLGRIGCQGPALVEWTYEDVTGKPK
jgi:hypothetical protein